MAGFREGSDPLQVYCKHCIRLIPRLEPVASCHMAVIPTIMPRLSFIWSIFNNTNKCVINNLILLFLLIMQLHCGYGFFIHGMQCIHLIYINVLSTLLLDIELGIPLVTKLLYDHRSFCFVDHRVLEKRHLHM